MTKSLTSLTADFIRDLDKMGEALFAADTLTRFLADADSTMRVDLLRDLLKPAPVAEEMFSIRVIGINFDQNNAKIHSIKAIRAMTGLGLRESKDFVEGFLPRDIEEVANLRGTLAEMEAVLRTAMVDSHHTLEMRIIPAVSLR